MLCAFYLRKLGGGFFWEKFRGKLTNVKNIKPYLREPNLAFIAYILYMPF